jgi:hypothetical protein
MGEVVSDVDDVAEIERRLTAFIIGMLEAVPEADTSHVIEAHY